ncbi:MULTISPECIES: response regulator [unclassified Mesorhizobium]|uniref:response regulator transcription factor n=1 Tax=unclassified Mesorhizobium TaxID=325217 RepID=UPI001092BB72|nr:MULTISPECIES: response regulator [unclassified Mesorhizobium]TGP93932.1 response regulator transcription factor [Mesorhizobium sp. M8A.F.Ca.ET.218.01.1.1]TGT18228.1 response regulator transcription factor [Mesorhizobium sp. M8A.F.Ca.ET.213.01.1.1]
MTDAMFQVSLIDDDVQVLKALSRVLSIAGYQVQTFTDAETFLDEHDPLLPGCTVVDLHLPGKSGFEIQEALDACGRPVVFLTGQGNVPASVRAMRAGAQDFLEKPVNTQTLLAAVEQARLVDVARRRNFQDQEDLKKRVARLTARERQVLDQVVAGRFNKQIAGDLGIVEKTVKVHRGRMMHKMGVRTVADLVRIVEHFNA